MNAGSRMHLVHIRSHPLLGAGCSACSILIRRLRVALQSRTLARAVESSSPRIFARRNQAHCKSEMVMQDGFAFNTPLLCKYLYLLSQQPANTHAFWSRRQCGTPDSGVVVSFPDNYASFSTRYLLDPNATTAIFFRLESLTSHP